MIKTFVKCIREYKLPTILTLFFIILEVFLEVLIPTRTADLVNAIKAGDPMGGVVRMGLILVAMALLSLGCGGGAGFMGAKASAGFAKITSVSPGCSAQRVAIQVKDDFVPLLRRIRYRESQR